jgi:Ca2+-binding RTX toxin-like protein
MQKFKFVLYLLSAVVLMGCGQTVVETLHVPDSPNTSAPGRGRTVIILPFADYTSLEAIDGAYRRSLTVSEAITDRLVAKGFSMAVQEDVFGYLVDENIINLSAYEGIATDSLSFELSNAWSDVMKTELQGYIQEQKMQSDKTVSGSPGTHAITTNALAKMGRRFNADYIVRGRILEYKTRQEATWAPWKKGVLPFINGGTNRILNGFAGSDEYDERNEALTGMLIGGIIGYNYTTWPWDDGQTFFGMADGSANTVTWAGVGAGLGVVSHTSGQVDQAAVQMRIWVQEAATGNVIWTNRVRVLVSPESVFADKQYDTLFNKAIEKGVDTLINHFVSYGL